MDPSTLNENFRQNSSEYEWPTEIPPFVPNATLSPISPDSSLSQSRDPESMDRECIRSDQHQSAHATPATGRAPTPKLPPNLTDLEGERIFHILWQRIWRVSRYRQYRGAVGSKSGGESKVWPPDREEAFWRACAYFPPRGRETVQHPGTSKKLGHNESIVKYINDMFNLVPNPDGPGKKWPLGDRTPLEQRAYGRKKISSKLAVLIPWFRDADPFVYGWLQGDHGRRASLRPPGRSSAYRAAARNRLSRLKRSPSELDYSANLNETTPESPFQELSTSLGRNPPPINPLDCFIFDMFCNVCESSDLHDHNCGVTRPSCALKRLHTFTKTISGCRMPDTYLHPAEYNRQFPEMASANLARHAECQVISAESSLALHPTELQLDSVNLGIDGKFATTNKLDPLCTWYCRTVFYDGNEAQELPEQLLREVNDPSNAGFYSHSLPFASTFWVKKLVDLDKDWKEAAELERKGHMYEHMRSFSEQSEKLLRMARSLREKISSAIKRLSARQEIIGYPSTASFNDRLPTTRLIINWRFRQAGKSESGVTQIRNIIITPHGEDPDTALACSWNMLSPNKHGAHDNQADVQSLDDGHLSSHQMTSYTSAPVEGSGFCEPHALSMIKHEALDPRSRPGSHTPSALSSADSIPSNICEDIPQLLPNSVEIYAGGDTTFAEHPSLYAPVPDHHGKYIEFIKNTDKFGRPQRLNMPYFNNFNILERDVASAPPTSMMCYPPGSYGPTSAAHSAQELQAGSMCAQDLYPCQPTDYGFPLVRGSFFYRQQVPQRRELDGLSAHGFYPANPFAPVPDIDGYTSG